MTFDQLVKTVARDNKISEKKADRIIRDIFETIVVEASVGRMSIPSFGTFRMKESRATGQTPAGIRWERKASKALRFTPSYKTGGRGGLRKATLLGPVTPPGATTTDALSRPVTA